MNIVIIDDEPKIRKGMQNLFDQQDGWHTVAFASAREALVHLHNQEVDVVITDIKMPGMTGLDLVEKLREVNQEVPVIILSGYSRFDYAQRAIDLGVRKYLTKPTAADEMLSLLNGIDEELRERRRAMQTKHFPVLAKPVSNLLILRALEFIEDNYASKLSLKDVADALYISPNYLSELFKRITDMTFSDYLLDLRMEKSKVYLADISHKIGDVAELVGFSNARYFSSAFRKKYHITPMDYRNQKAGTH